MQKHILCEWPLTKCLFPAVMDLKKHQLYNYIETLLLFMLVFIYLSFCFSMAWTAMFINFILAHLSDCLQPGTQL